jgi:hypothetical protein
LFAETALVKTETDNGRLANHLVHLAQNPIVRPMALTTNAAAIDAVLLRGLATSSPPWVPRSCFHWLSSGPAQ